MKGLVVYVLAIIAALATGSPAEAADCGANPQAVWTSHPHAHPRWRLRDGQQCWYAGHFSLQHARRGRHRAYGMVMVPPPQRDWLTPQEGKRLADFLFGE